MTAVMFDHVRISTGNFKDCITEQLELTIDYSDIFGNEDLDGYINNIIKMIDTLPDNAMILKSVLAVKLVMQLKILNIVNKNFIENMKKTFSHCPYIKDPLYAVISILMKITSSMILCVNIDSARWISIPNR